MAIPGHLRNHPLFSGGRFGLMSGESPRFPATQKPTHENLVNHLRNQGIGFEETHGRYDDPERSVIIHSPTRELMAGLGKHFGQESVVFSDKGKHELLYTNGEHEGKSRLTKPGSEPIDWFHEAPPNYYTHLPNHGYFRINFDWESDPQHHGPVQVAPSAPAPMTKARPPHENSLVTADALQDQGFKPTKGFATKQGLGTRLNSIPLATPEKGLPNKRHGEAYDPYMTRVTLDTPEGAATVNRIAEAAQSRYDNPTGAVPETSFGPREPGRMYNQTFTSGDRVNDKKYWQRMGSEPAPNPTLGIAAPDREAWTRSPIMKMKKAELAKTWPKDDAENAQSAQGFLNHPVAQDAYAGTHPAGDQVTVEEAPAGPHHPRRDNVAESPSVHPETLQSGWNSCRSCGEDFDMEDPSATLCPNCDEHYGYEGIARENATDAHTQEPAIPWSREYGKPGHLDLDGADATADKEYWRRIGSFTDREAARDNAFPGVNPNTSNATAIPTKDVMLDALSRSPIMKMKKHDFKGAAFKHTPTGKIITTGERHELEGLDHAAFDRGEYQDGFVDSQGQFFNRDEALAAVRREGMPEPKNADGTVELHSTDLFKAGQPSDILQVLADELEMQGWSPNEIPQSTGLTAARIRGPQHKASPVMLTNILDARTDQHGANLEADAQERGHTFGDGLHRAAEQQVLHDMALAPTSRDPDDSNYHGGNAFHHNSLPGVMEADKFGKDLTQSTTSPDEAATSVAGNIPTVTESRTAWLRSKAHPHSYEWHDGHSDHHRTAPNLEAIQKSFGLYKADLPKNDQAAGVGAPMYAKFAGPYGEVRGRATPSDLTHYNYHGKLPEIEALVKKHGFKTYFAGGKYGKPDLQAKNYNNGHLMIYDPTPSSGGDFKDHQYTNAWRQIHELSHALVYPELNSIYGEGRRIGKLGTHRTPNEAMRAVHWEWLAAHKQRDLSAKLGIHVPDETFHKELNTVMHDAVHRAVTGQFTEPAGEGFVPHSHKVPLHIALDTVRNEAQAMGIQHPHGLAKRPMMKAWPKDDAENAANAAAHKAIIERAEVFGDKQEEQGLPRTGVHPNSLKSLRSRAQKGGSHWATAEARHTNDIARFNAGWPGSDPVMPAKAYIDGGGYDEAPYDSKGDLNDRNYWAGIGRAAGIQKSDPGTPLHADANTFMAALKGLPKGSPERGKFVTQHMNHGPFLAALQAHPQGVQIHKMLTGFLNSKANAGPGLPMKTVAKSEPHVILSKQGNTMSEKTYTPQEAVEVLKKAASDKIKAMEYRLQDLRKRELSKGLIPTHKHNAGSSASAAVEDVPPSKLNAPGKDDKLVGGTATQKVEESSTEDSPHGAEETSGEISAADMTKALLCKKCGKTHDLEKACDGMDKAELVDAKGNTESNSEESAATMPDDESKHVNKPTKSKPGSGGVITKGKKLGKSLGEIRSLAKAMAPPTAKPPSGTNMATKVPTSAPKAPPMGKKAQEMDKAVDKIVVPKSQKPKVPSNERDHTVQVSKDKTVYEAKKPELEKGVMSDIAAKNNAGAPAPKDPGANVKLPTPGQQEGRANMFGAAMAGEYQPPGTKPTAKLAAPAKPATALASPKAAGIAAKPAVSAGPVMNAARPSKPGIFGRLLGKK